MTVQNSKPQADLVPVFIPTLSAILVSVEDKKGSPLTEAEAMKIRDTAAVIMMETADAKQMDETRGYRDIDPENLWRDWQALRNQMGRKPALPVGPRFNTVRAADPKLQQAVVDAQESLGAFRKLIAAAKTMGTRPMIKTRLTDGTNSSFMWLCDTIPVNDGFKARLFEVPSNWTTYKKGDVIAVKTGDVMDWMVNHKGHLHGGFSIRVLRESKSEIERREYDSYIGVETYAPLPGKD